MALHVLANKEKFMVFTAGRGIKHCTVEHELLYTLQILYTNYTRTVSSGQPFTSWRKEGVM